MNNPNIDGVMSYPWQPKIASTPSGGFVLTVFPPLVDFELYAKTREELEADWRDALRSHLAGYISTNKIIPIPHIRLQQPTTRGARGGVQRFVVEGGQVESVSI